MRRRDVIALLLSAPGLAQAQGIHEPGAMTKVAARAFAIYRKQDRARIWELYSTTKVPTSMTMRTFEIDDIISQPLRCEVND